MNFFHTLVFALILTVLMEYAVYLFLIRKDPMNLFLYSFLINSFTNPLFNYIYNYEFHMLYPLEIAVAIVESILIFFLMELSYPKAILVSLVCQPGLFSSGLDHFWLRYLDQDRTEETEHLSLKRKLDKIDSTHESRESME